MPTFDAHICYSLILTFLSSNFESVLANVFAEGFNRF